MGARYVDRRCGYCGGTGKKDTGQFTSNIVKCKVCKGHTVVSVPSTYRKCPDCDGGGRKDVGKFSHRWVDCKRCECTGWAEPPPKYGRC